MGLSDGERFAGVANVVSGLSQLKFECNDYDLHAGSKKKFNQLLDSLWPAFIGSKSNGGHWIFGSDTDNYYLDEMSLFRCAIKDHVLDGYALKDLIVSEEERKFKAESEALFDSDISLDDIKDPVRRASIEFNRHMDEFVPTASKLLENKSKAMSLVYTIQKYTESYFYYCNRYDDKLSKQFKSVTAIIAKLVGLCYIEQSSKPEYAQAWMLGNIFKSVFTYDQTDVVNDWFIKQNLHHSLRLPNTKEGEQFINKIFVNWQGRPKHQYALDQRLEAEAGHDYKYEDERKPNRNVIVSVEERLMFVLDLFYHTGKYGEYEHQHKQLFKLIEDHNLKITPKVMAKISQKAVAKKTKKKPLKLPCEVVAQTSMSNFIIQFIDLNKVKEACKKLQEKYVAKKKQDRYAIYCSLTNQRVN